MDIALYKVSVPTAPDAEEAAVTLLEGLFGRTPCVETDLETNTTKVSVFLEQPPPRAMLKGVLPKFSVRKLAPQNWAESWKRHFKPIEIGSKLLIKPSWSRRKAKPGQRVIVLDPGLSFGTGQHPTTHFCLEQIAAFRDERPKQSFLDAGTGSGILAIAAAKLGYARVRAFDFDPAAVRIARANAMRNRIADRIHFACKDFTREKADSRYDLICANLLADLLESQRDRLLAWLKPSGRLVLSGILRSQFRNIQRLYERNGLNLISHHSQKEWKSGAFARPEFFSENTSCVNSSP
jgi:ribosomal protein L11 methyltransferase